MSILPRRPFTDRLGAEKPSLSPAINAQNRYTSAQINNLARTTVIKHQGNPKRSRRFANESEFTGQKRSRYNEEYGGLPRGIQSNIENPDLGFVPKALLPESIRTNPVGLLEDWYAANNGPWSNSYDGLFHKIQSQIRSPIIIDPESVVGPHDEVARTQAGLKVHNLLYKKPFYCDVPGRSCSKGVGFLYKKDLHRHIQSYHWELEASNRLERYRCLVPDCKLYGRSWARQDNLNRHLRRFHASKESRTDANMDAITQRCKFSSGPLSSAPSNCSVSPAKPNIDPFWTPLFPKKMPLGRNLATWFSSADNLNSQLPSSKLTREAETKLFIKRTISQDMTMSKENWVQGRLCALKD